MSKESDILKWYNGEISTEDIKKRYSNEDFTVLQKTRFYATHLQAPKVDSEKALADFKAKTFKKKETEVIPLNYKTFLRIAALVIVMLSASYFVFFNNEITFSTEIAQTETFSLPDNSEVILNAKSNLSYNKKSWKENRTLTLEGEAFFKVTKGEKFTVKTEAGHVKVLGTQFNVKERDNYFEVQCYEGLVSVTFNNHEALVNPGETYRIVNGEVISVKSFSAKKPTWLARESAFEEVPLWRVIDELEIQYGLNIIEKNIDTSILFTGSFTHTDKEIAIQSITIPINLSYKISGNRVELFSYDHK